MKDFYDCLLMKMNGYKSLGRLKIAYKMKKIQCCKYIYYKKTNGGQ